MNRNEGVLIVRTISTDGRAVVNVQGDVDMATAPQFRTLLLQSAAESVGPLLLDLSGVAYMDSSGVGTMVYLKREIERRGRQLVLIGLQPRVRGVLEITHLDRFFTIVGSLDEVAQR